MFFWIRSQISHLRFSRSEWIFLVVVSGVLLVAINANYVYGFLQSNDEYRFAGFLVNTYDQMTYLSHMEYARDGNFLLTILYTSEEVPPRIVNFFFPLMGYFSLFASKLFVYHLARNILAIMLVFLLYFFLGYFFRRSLHKKIVLLFLLFTAGWGVYMLAVAPLISHQLFGDVAPFTAYIDLMMPEAHLFSSLYVFPHFVAALILNLLVYIFIFEYLKTEKRKAIFLAALTAFILGFVHLYEMITIYAVLTSFLLVRWHQTKNFKKYIFNFFPLYGISLIPMLYQFWMILYYKESYGALGKTILLSPPFAALFMSFGIFSVFVLCFFIVFFKTGRSIQNMYEKQLAGYPGQYNEIWTFLLFWILLNVILMYLPLPPQRRFIQGLQIPIVILGSMTLFYLFIPFIARWSGRWVNLINQKKVLLGIAGIILLSHLASPVWMLSIDYNSLANYKPYLYQKWNYYYISTKIYQGLSYIKDADIQGTILSNKTVGNWIPSFNANRVYQGHTSQTFDRLNKQKDWEEFLTQEGSSEQKHEFLKKHNIAYVVYVGDEIDYAVFKNPQYLELVHRSEEVEMYKVLRD